MLMKVCSCTNEQLQGQIEESAFTISQMTGYMPEVLDTKEKECTALRCQHQLMIDGIHKTGARCPNVITKDIKVPNEDQA